MRLLRLATLALVSLTVWGCSDHRQPLGPDSEARTVTPARAGAGFAGPGAVYTMTNAAGGNEVLAFARSANGLLSGPATHATGGEGTGGGLGNQSGVILHEGRLFVVNAGSDEITVFDVSPAGLVWRATSASGGNRPISLAAHGARLYVLHAGGAGGVAGFDIGPAGQLTPIPGSVRDLGGADTGPAQIGVSGNGRHLVVSLKAANGFAVYRIEPDGALSLPERYPSHGDTPFGFAFDPRGILVVSEAFGGMPGRSAVSSYRVLGNGALSLRSGSVPTHQTAACWIAIPDAGGYAYTTNTGSGSVSGYAIDGPGSIALLDADGVTAATDTSPIDAAFGGGGRFLYVLNAGSGTLTAYDRAADGGLAPVTGAAGLPAGSNGLAAW